MHSRNLSVSVQADGEAWLHPPGIIRIMHKNRVQITCRDRVSARTESGCVNYATLNHFLAPPKGYPSASKIEAKILGNLSRILTIQGGYEETNHVENHQESES